MAKDRPIAQMTYREKIRDATHLARELIDHVGQSMLPRLAELQSQLKPRTHHKERDKDRGEEIEDLTIRNSATTVMESNHYTQQLSARMEELGQAIVAESNKVVYDKN